MDTTRMHDGRHDFDFLHGRWQVRSERLRERLVGSEDWEVFDGRQECRPLLDGGGNVDELRSDWGGGFAGVSLRLFDATSGRWRIWWASNRSGELDPPVTGGFDKGGLDADRSDDGCFGEGCGRFVGRAEHAGTPVLMRFTWERLGTNTAHWHQAFSADDGASWETNWHMWLRRLGDDDRPRHDDAVVELRQYTLQPGQRDTLVTLFEREFLEPQEAVGMHVIGQFRDLDDPDRFVWLRGFESMPARRAALQAFYTGPVWLRHRTAANATMVDSDDVLLLKPAQAGSGLAVPERARPALAETAAGAGAVAVGVCSLAAGAQADFAARFQAQLAPRLRACGGRLLAAYVSETAANTFPRLPVRDADVFVWLLRFDDVASLDHGLALLREDAAWLEAISRALLAELEEPPQWLRLAPTPRSELR